MYKLVALVLLVLFPFSSVASAAEQVFFYHTDPVGTPVAMTNTNGQVVWRADFKPFGEEYSVTATPKNNKELVGKEKDEETGLYYFGARYLDSKAGRFAAVDPVRAVDVLGSKTNESLLLNPQQLNLFGYGLNNPCRYLDPNGRTVLLKGNVEQVMVLDEHYERLKQKSVTARLVLKVLEKSNTVYVIRMGKENSYLAGIITYNPDKHHLSDNPTDDWQFRPPEVGLAHEAIHALHDDEHPFLAAIRSRGKDEAMTVGIGAYKDNPYTENAVRRDYNVKERPVY